MQIKRADYKITNGVGEPRLRPGDLQPGWIVRWGIDDDNTAVYLGAAKHPNWLRLAPWELFFLPLMWDPEDKRLGFKIGQVVVCSYENNETISVVMDNHQHVYTGSQWIGL